MKIFIPSHKRAGKLSTPKLLDAEGIDYRVVLSTEAEKSEYIASGLPTEKIIVSNTKGLSATRQFCIEQAELGEWLLFLDDNHKGIECVADGFYEKEALPVKHDKSLKAVFENKISYKKFLDEVVPDSIKKAESMRLCAIGFALTPNFFFRERKWLKSILKFEMSLIKRTALKLDPELSAMEDYDFTAQHVWKYGGVLINNWVSPIQNHYQPGGLGTYEERLPEKIRCCSVIMQKYPGLFRYNQKATGDAGAELLIRLRSELQIEKWRFFMNHLKDRVVEKSEN